MTDHLPECVVIAGDGMCGICQEDRCICAQLRACEQRVRDDVRDGHHTYYQQVRDEALSAARDAVAALRGVGSFVDGVGNVVSRTAALAAIDALGGESND